MGGSLDDLQFFQDVLMKLVAVDEEHFEEGINMADGGAQIVGDGIRESFEVVIGLLQLAGAFFDFELALVIEAQDLLFLLFGGGDVEDGAVEMKGCAIQGAFGAAPDFDPTGVAVRRADAVLEAVGVDFSF